MKQKVDIIKMIQKKKEELIANVKYCLIKPSLAMIQIGSNPKHDKELYLLQEVAEEVGVNLRVFAFDEEVMEQEIINKVIELNNDEYVDGIMVQLPINHKYHVKKLLNMIDPNKDIGGLTERSQNRLFQNRKGFVSPICLAILELLKASFGTLNSKHITIIGTDHFVAHPMANLCMKEDAIVTMSSHIVDHCSFMEALILVQNTKQEIKIDSNEHGMIVIDMRGVHEESVREELNDIKIDLEKNILISYENILLLSYHILLKYVVLCYNRKSAS